MYRLRIIFSIFVVFGEEKLHVLCLQLTDQIQTEHTKHHQIQFDINTFIYIYTYIYIHEKCAQN